MQVRSGCTYIENDLTRLCDISSTCCYPSRHLFNELCLSSLPVYSEGSWRLSTQPLCCRHMSAHFWLRVASIILLSSFAQFFTNELGHAIIHLSIVGFPARGDCLRRVHINAMHCKVFPRPISSAIIHLKSLVLVWRTNPVWSHKPVLILNSQSSRTPVQELTRSLAHTTTGNPNYEHTLTPST